MSTVEPDLIIPQSEPLVDILMPTFNHESFIEQAILSVLMQESDFRYRLIIADDCSTDRTSEICESYYNRNRDRMTYFRNEVNLGLATNYKLLFNVSTAKYIAILEGDDLWSDRHKLQKQVSILESMPDVGLVHTNYISLYENGTKKIGHMMENRKSLSGHVIGPTQTASINITPLTVCFRGCLAKGNVDFDYIIENALLTVDIFIWAEVGRRSQVYFIDHITGVYRIHSKSLTGDRNIESIEKFSRTSLLSVRYLMEKYETPQHVKEYFYSGNRINLIYQYLLANQSDKAKQLLIGIKKPMNLKAWIIYVSAKYQHLNFLSKILEMFYKTASSLKQAIGTLLD